MTKQLKYILILLPLLTTTTFAQVDPETPDNAAPIISDITENLALSFTDEFNSTEVNTDKWTIDNSSKSRASRPGLGISNWFWRPDNVEVKDGNLVLKVSKYNSNTMHCGSINSRNKFETTYGYFEARIKIAEAAKGTHTAFWLQGQGMSNIDGTANDGAEIDVFESAWLEDYTKSVLHIDGYSDSHQANTKKYTTPGIHEGFHTFSLYWTKDFLKIYYDGELKVTYNDAKWLVHADEYLWLSDGASFGFSGDHFTSADIGYLTEAHVDYIRVWTFEEKTDDSDELVKNGDFEDSSNSDWISADNYSDVFYNESTYPVNESQCCRMPGAGQSRAISQSITVDEEREYSFAFSGRIQNSHGESGSADNNRDGKGVATLKAEIIADNTTLKTFTIQSNTNTTSSGVFSVPQNINEINLKLSKNWNIAYIDEVSVKSNSTASTKEKPLIMSTIFPNPASDNFTLSSKRDILSYAIYNNNGQLVKSAKNIYQQHTDINISNLTPGSYLVYTKQSTQYTEIHKVIIY